MLNEEGEHVVIEIPVGRDESWNSSLDYTEYYLCNRFLLRYFPYKIRYKSHELNERPCCKKAFI